MASTHLSLHYHHVFSTKNREAWFSVEERERVHRYLGDIVRFKKSMCDYCRRGWWSMMTDICGEAGVSRAPAGARMFAGLGPVVALVSRSTTG